MSSQQRRDVERHLRDGAERGVHHRSHREVTLGGNAVGIKTNNVVYCSLGIHCRSGLSFHSHSSYWPVKKKQKKTNKKLPGNTHANEVRQRNDGGNGRGKLGLCADISVFMVNIANNQSDYYQGKKVWREQRLKENKWMAPSSKP